MRAITSSPAENLPIGELSKRSGVNIETIRYYERVKCWPHRRGRTVAAASIIQRTFVSSSS